MYDEVHLWICQDMSEPRTRFRWGVGVVGACSRLLNALLVDLVCTRGSGSSCLRCISFRYVSTAPLFLGVRVIRRAPDFTNRIPFTKGTICCRSCRDTMSHRVHPVGDFQTRPGLRPANPARAPLTPELSAILSAFFDAKMMRRGSAVRELGADSYALFR